MKIVLLKKKEVEKIANYIYILEALEVKISSGKDLVSCANVMNVASASMNEQMNKLCVLLIF